MITFCGVRIEPSNKFNGQYNGTPTLVDIVLGLGRMPRYAGQTRRWWTGLHHSLVCCAIAHHDLKPSREMFLCLMHDAHECVTGDVPAFFKPVEMSVWQDEIDERIYKGLGIWPITPQQAAYVKYVDTRALRAEAAIIGPPTIMCHLADPLPQDAQIVEQVLAAYPSPLDTDGPDSSAARAFLASVANLIGGAVIERHDDTPPKRRHET